MLRFCRAFGLMLISVCLFLGLGCLSARTAFEGGDEYTFYLDSASSRAEIYTCPSSQAVFFKYFFGDRIAGESTVYGEEQAQKILEKYRAEVLFTEQTDGVLSYYCYSPELPSGIELFGYFVNLHVAERGTVVAVGTPVIFGGF